jgi:hypothetical protein
LKTYTINTSAVSELKSRLTAQGFSVYELNTCCVQDRLSFFKAALASSPMGDAIYYPEITWAFPQDWNAFSDFLWQGLTEKDMHVAIIWAGNADLQANHPELYNDAIDIISTADGTGGASNFSPLLFLTGPNFTSSLPI